jgi:hypothetical protein
MWVPLSVAAIVTAGLAWELAAPRLRAALPRLAGELAQRRAWREPPPALAADPGRERRAEQRARELLRSCVNEEEWAMYRELGLLRVASRAAGGDPPRNAPGDAPPPCAYLVYPHRPIVAYRPATGEVVGEYCVAFPDETCPYGSARLPDADDVLAKWMALTGDERRVIDGANMHLPGRQVALRRVRADLARLERWERERAIVVSGRAPIPRAGSVRAA